MQQPYVFSVLLIWLGLPGTMSLVFTTGITCTGFYLVWALLFGLPFLLRPLAGVERHLRPAMTLISHRRNQAWVHLAPWQRTTNLTPFVPADCWRISKKMDSLFKAGLTVSPSQQQRDR